MDRRQVKAALSDAHRTEDAESAPAYFNKGKLFWEKRNVKKRRSGAPEHSCRFEHMGSNPYLISARSSGHTSVQDRHQYNFISLGFVITRMVGYSLMATWLFESEPEIEQLLLPIEITTKQN